MLRTVLLALGGAAALAGAILILAGVPAGVPALAFGVLVVVGIAFERWRYRAKETRPGAGWQPTGERFEDPETGKTIEVFYDPRSGERRYVNDSDPPPPPGSRAEPRAGA